MREKKTTTIISRAIRLRLRITAAAESIVRGGHPWVFADSVREQNRAGAPGELAVIYDRKDKFLAVGLFDPDSPIRVRVLHAGKPATLDAAWWAARLDAAVHRRDGLFDERTTGYRLVNGESDGWPGLVLDHYDTTLVLKIYTAAWLARLAEVIELIRKRLTPERIVLRLSRNIQRAASSTGTKNWHDGGLVFQELPEPAAGGPVIFLESGLRFEADVVRGQKTGFFLDQRENRRLAESLARGRAVLNAFSFSGGFSLYAAHGGANSVTDLDISSHALESAKRNFALNQGLPAFARCRHECIQTDAFEWLAGNSRRRFDLILLDPPSLAKREAERTGAIRAYGKLVNDGLQHLSPGGVLVACSCSAHVSAEEFFSAVRSAASTSGRKFAEMQTTRHAPDHPARFKEAEYLKGIFLRFES
jgi:23S rRNA (cytosine1962-C5)-methyltransferase